LVRAPRHVSIHGPQPQSLLGARVQAQTLRRGGYDLGQDPIKSFQILGNDLIFFSIIGHVAHGSIHPVQVVHVLLQPTVDLFDRFLEGVEVAGERLQRPEARAPGLRGDLVLDLPGDGLFDRSVAWWLCGLRVVSC